MCKRDGAKLRLSCFVPVLMFHSRPIAHFQSSNRQNWIKTGATISCPWKIEPALELLSPAMTAEGPLATQVTQMVWWKEKMELRESAIGWLRKQKSKAANLQQSSISAFNRLYKSVYYCYKMKNLYKKHNL